MKQISYYNRSHIPIQEVIRAGFEPATHSLEGCCSIQLSYRTVVRNYSGTENCLRNF